VGTAAVRIICLGRQDRSDRASAVLCEASELGADTVHALPKKIDGASSFDQGSIDWRRSLSSSHWLLNCSSTVLEGDSSKWAWGASMAFAELEGSRSAMLVEVPPRPEMMAEAWGAVIERIRQIHLLFIEHDALDAIAEIEGIKPERLLASIRQRSLVPLVCSYDPSSREARIEHVFGVTEVVTDISMSAESWLAAFLCELPQTGPGGEGIQMAAKVQVKKNKR